jgi:hypothetical protein
VRTRRIEAARTVHEKRHERIEAIPVLRETSSEAMNVMDPPSDERPRTCSERIASEIEEEELYVASESGQ